MAPRRSASLVALLAVLLLMRPVIADSQPLLTWANEATASKVSAGVLFQPTVDLVTGGSAPLQASVALRRARVMVSGTFGKHWTVFADTDAPQLGLHVGRDVPTELFLQDLAVTYTVRPGVHVDTGLLLVPLAYNTMQSAASLLAVSFGPQSFLASTPTTSRVGRDWGTVMRAYPWGGHLELRGGVFPGARDALHPLPARVAGRVAWHVAAPQKGLFYVGTALGAKRIATLGAGVDHQAGYTAWAVDGMIEQPLPGGDAVTLQVDAIRYDGGRTFVTLPRQQDWLVEGGYFRRPWRTSPYVQWSRQSARSGVPALTAQVGLAVWARGQRMNVKCGVGRVWHAGAAPRLQVVTQVQLFAF